MKEMRSKSWLLVLLAGLSILCSFRTGPEKFIRLHFPNGAAITAELAVSDKERQLGLMFREKINFDEGMLFIFEEESSHSFWMKNMNFAIDILWLDKEKRVVHIEEQVPPCLKDPCPSYPPLLPAMYVLELQSGSAARLKLKLYDRLEFILPRQLRQ
jgi:uncharacterized membrane protein (UPF0127 family)